MFLPVNLSNSGLTRIPSGGIAAATSASVGNGSFGAAGAVDGGGEFGRDGGAVVSPFSALIFLDFRPPSEVTAPSVSEPAPPRIPCLRFFVGAEGAEEGGIGGEAGRDGG